MDTTYVFSALFYGIWGILAIIFVVLLGRVRGLSVYCFSVIEFLSQLHLSFNAHL
jgi:hypothetical protein